MISQLYHKRAFKSISCAESYKDVWDIISKKKNILKKDFGIDCEYKIP